AERGSVSAAAAAAASATLGSGAEAGSGFGGVVAAAAAAAGSTVTAGTGGVASRGAGAGAGVRIAAAGAEAGADCSRACWFICARARTERLAAVFGAAVVAAAGATAVTGVSMRFKPARGCFQALMVFGPSQVGRSAFT